MALTTTRTSTRPVLVLGGTGTTGRRVARRLAAAGCPVRVGSRRADPPFSWEDPSGWERVLDGARAAYVCFAPDLAVPGAPEVVASLARAARAASVERLVLLSGRGEEEAERAEREVRAVDPATTVVRSSFFLQNLDEGLLAPEVAAGLLRLPPGGVREPFVDVEDVADVAAAALLDDRHAGEAYEVTGPELLSFADLAAGLSAALGREVRYERVDPGAWAAALAAQGLPPEVVDLLRYLFTEVLDGRGERLGDGVQRALGRPPRPFAEYARRAAAGGAWG
ncbi:NmrA family transcriptional regulator [Vallicoccus soli]|uniref:NmrA family transcriptional regulator n=1 Tax=Vallicoccus soli TaxID=2339232 RepID=A0A3A3YZD8_9ACTN|nr:NmrA family transcriptional regulator [Vallicoccus soli]RJK97111.1 NmrA family transcriptional regulator [Vallicoccus soli]